MPATKSPRSRIPGSSVTSSIRNAHHQQHLSATATPTYPVLLPSPAPHSQIPAAPRAPHPSSSHPALPALAPPSPDGSAFPRQALLPASCATRNSRATSTASFTSAIRYFLFRCLVTSHPAVARLQSHPKAGTTSSVLSSVVSFPRPSVGKTLL